jgi:hypothetical protein
LRGSLFGKMLSLSGRRAHQECECCQLEQAHGVSPTPSFPSRVDALWAAKADGAGDRDRTGDIQLGKLALPSALLDKDIKNQQVAHILNGLSGMTVGELSALVAYLIPPFGERWTVWTVRRLIDRHGLS